MVGNTQKEQFTNLRFDNYAAARKLGFTCVSFIRNALYLNGMTIELTYKQILLEAKKRGFEISNTDERIINKSHDLEVLHNMCLSKGLLKEIKDYEPFLAYANLFYKTRYPIHVTEIMKKATERFKNLSFSVHNIFPYDEFICELDNSFFHLTDEHEISIIYRALTHINNHQTLSIFHSNYYAYNQIDQYVKFLNPNNESQKESISFLKEKRNGILKNAGQYLSSNEEGVLKSSYKNFKANFNDIM